MGKYDEYLKVLKEIPEIGLCKETIRTAKQEEYVKQMLEEVYREINVLQEKYRHLEKERNEKIFDIKKEYESKLKTICEQTRELYSEIPYEIQKERDRQLFRQRGT